MWFTLAVVAGCNPKMELGSWGHLVHRTVHLYHVLGQFTFFCWSADTTLEMDVLICPFCPPSQHQCWAMVGYVNAPG